MTTIAALNHHHLPPHPHRPPLLPSVTRRSFLLSTATTTTLPSLSSPPPDTTVTDRIFLDFSLCPSYFLSRTLGEADLSLCSDPEPVGRVVLGLYGNFLPITVSNFKAMCGGRGSSSSDSSYRGTLVQKIFPGQFFVAGRQGRRDKGDVKPPSTGLLRNTETVDSRAFALGHSKPGLISLCLSENDDDESLKLRSDYHNVEFLITTGPGPCPQLDNKNIVFGTVIEGMDVVRGIAAIPTYKPGERIRQYNDLAEFLGDERAKTARNIWNRPLKTLYISDCGHLVDGKPPPALSPSLP